MARQRADMVMILLGVTSAVLLIAYGVVAAMGTEGSDPIFWLLVIAFLVYLTWDIRRHLRALGSR